MLLAVGPGKILWILFTLASRFPIGQNSRIARLSTRQHGVPTLMHGASPPFHVFMGKAAVPLQAWSGPERPRKLRFPDFMTTTQNGGKVVSLTHRPPLISWNAPGTHFCWRRSRPQGLSVIWWILYELVEALPYKPEGLWFDSWWCHWNFSLT